MSLPGSNSRPCSVLKQLVLISGYRIHRQGQTHCATTGQIQFKIIASLFVMSTGSKNMMDFRKKSYLDSQKQTVRQEIGR